MTKIICFLLSFLCFTSFLTGCAVTKSESSSELASILVTDSSQPQNAEQPTSNMEVSKIENSIPQNEKPCYFDSLVKRTLFKINFSGKENDFEKILKVFDFIVATTSYIETDQPELTEIWKYQDKCGVSPSIHQVLSVSPLEFGAASCEHYASALMTILEYMGYKTQYVSGLTYSTEGELVDHAWMMVKVQGDWYHVDPQLEDNAIYNGVITYKYFLKDDSQFEAHHVWGVKLPNPDEQALKLPKCKGNLAYSVPPRHISQLPALPMEELIKKAEKFKNGVPVKLKPLSEMPPFPSQMKKADADNE